MIAKRILLLITISCAFASWGQFTYRFDTLSINHRMLGSIDSVDIKSGYLPTTFDGGMEILSENGFSLSRLNSNFGGLRFDQSLSNQPLTFSALPYIGFGYSFGGQGTQFIRAEYAQAFTDSLILNLNFNGNIGNGFLRRAAFVSNRVNLDLEWKSKWYTLQLSGNYFSDTIQHNGGIDTLESFGLIFAPVRKLNAASANKYGRVAMNNYFHLNPDQANRIGLLTNHIYDIRYRAYHEFDTLSGIYSMVNIDSSTTYDRYNLARIQNGVGAFYSTKNNYVDFSVNHRYWSNLNLGNDFDTSEIDLHSNFRWEFGQLLLKNQFTQNILGGFGAMSNHTQLSYNRSNITVSGKLDVERTAPTPLQRNYFSNNYNYQLSTFGLENRLKVGGEGVYSFKGDSMKVGASFDLLTIRNAYLFYDSIWEGSGSMNAIQFGAFAQFQVGKFHFHPRVIYSIEQKGYLPSVQGYARVYFKSTVFKAKKLLLLLGVDGSYISSFNPRSYIPSMDAYSWNLISTSTTPMVNAHAFASIEISTFRFFVRYENIGYFWNDKSNQETVDYPIAGQRIRLGLTWSFFN